MGGGRGWVDVYRLPWEGRRGVGGGLVGGARCLCAGGSPVASVRVGNVRDLP